MVLLKDDSAMNASPWSRVRRSLRFVPQSLWILGIGLLILVTLQLITPAALWLLPPSGIQHQHTLQDFIATLVQVLSGVLGLIISVVAIVVQLTAARFTPEVTPYFNYS